jgi:hypothetical protein
MTAKDKRAMPGWAYAALVLIAILLFAVAFYLKERAERNGGGSRAVDASLQQRTNCSDAQLQCNAYAVRRSDFYRQVLYFPAAIPNISSNLEQERSHETAPLFRTIGVGTC